jgi:hypothetical protein
LKEVVMGKYEGLVAEFREVFPTCPICGSDLGYDAITKSLVFHIRCKSCEAVWYPSRSLSTKKLDRLLLVEPDKDRRARSLVNKGEKGWHIFTSGYGYKVEFWKSLDLGEAKRGEEPMTPSRPPLADLEKHAVDLERYAALKEKGLITEEEYNQQKKKILGM